jgi:phage baseplate assembly protein W
MAIVLGSKIVKDTKEYNDYALGISLPIQIGDVAFNQTFQTIDQVKTNIKSLLLTKKFERLMQPELGSGLQEILFEPADDEIATKIEDTIVSTISKWLPYVTIQQINVDTKNELKDKNEVDVSIKFTVGNSTNLESITFTVQG